MNESPETNRVSTGKPQGVIAANTVERIYHPFVKGTHMGPKEKGEGLPRDLRDTGASQSLMLNKFIPEGTRNKLKKITVIRGITGEPMKIPLCKVKIKSKWKSGPIVVGVVDNLPMKGISLLLRNDVGGKFVYPKAKNKDHKMKVSAMITRQESSQMSEPQELEPR